MGPSYLRETAVHSANARLDEAIEARPLAAMAQGDEIFLAFDELLF
jgi:hypothetical protein